MAQIQEENESVKRELRVLKVDLAGAIAGNAETESKLKRSELALKREQLERET